MNLRILNVQTGEVYEVEPTGSCIFSSDELKENETSYTYGGDFYEFEIVDGCYNSGKYKEYSPSEMRIVGAWYQSMKEEKCAHLNALNFRVDALL